MRTRQVAVAGCEVAVHESAGRGPAALLVHGNSSSSRAFRHQLEGPLGAECRLVAIDLPGHGRSAKANDSAETYSMPGFARVVVEAARELELEAAVFVGWSLGGHIVLEAAPLLPRAAGFCIFGTPPIANPPNFDRAFLPSPAGALLFKEDLTEDEIRLWISCLLSGATELPDQFVEDMRATDPTMRSGMLASIGTLGFRDEVQVVAALDQPLAVLHGECDQFTNLEYIATLAMPSLWRASVQCVPHGSHAPQWENPPAFDALLGAFLLETPRYR